MTVTVYSKPNCVQCKFTKQALKRAGIEFQDIDVMSEENANILAELKAAGFRQMPVVKAGKDTWSGFNPGKVAGLQA